MKTEQQKEVTDQQIKRRNFISFTAFGVLGGLAVAGWEWLYKSGPENPGITAGAHKPLRRALNKTELFFRRVFSDNHFVKTYPKAMAAKQVRQNGDLGIDAPPDNNWRLAVEQASGQKLFITLDELKALPKTEIVYDFKCVEGWDQIQHWGGVKFMDFINHYKLQDQIKKEYVGFETPDGGYYVGIDMPSAVHPQTILAYEVNDKPLPLENGYPLRLIIPVKYGIKNLKRIGSITFSNNRPRDYWAENGYDYYSGL